MLSSVSVTRVSRKSAAKFFQDDQHPWMHEVCALITESKSDDAVMAISRQRPEVGEVGVVGQQRAFQFLRLGEDVFVYGATQFCLDRPQYVNSPFPQKVNGAWLDILVSEQAH